MKKPPRAGRGGGEINFMSASYEDHKFAQTSEPFVSVCVKCGVRLDWYKVRYGGETIPLCQPKNNGDQQTKKTHD